MQLRHKFFLALALLTIVPLLVLLFGVVERMELAIKNRTQTVLHSTLDKMAGEIDVLLHSQKSIAVGLTRVPSVRNFADAAVRNSSSEYGTRAEELGRFFLNYQHAVPSIQALRFIDITGKTLVKVKEGEAVEPKRFDSGQHRYYVSDQSYKDYFKLAMHGQDDISMSDFELGQVTAGADFCPSMVRYSVVMRDELDVPQGMLVVNMWGKRVDATVEASLGGYPGRVYIVELNNGSPRDGIYLYHPDSDKRFANQLGSEYRLSHELTPQEWQTIKSTAEFGALFRADGRMLFFRKYSPYQDRTTQWLLVIEPSSETVLAPVREMRHSIWMLLAILVVLCLLVAVWAAVQMAKPVHRLAEIITRYADGERRIRYQDRRADEIGVAGRAFNYLADGLERANHERHRAEQAVRQSERLAAVGQLAAGIGHEINNPLMNIMSLAALLEPAIRNAGDEQMNSDIQLLQKEGKRCAHIVQGILNFARENKPQYRLFDMAELLEETLDLLKHRISSGEILVRLNIHDSLGLEGDPNQLQQVLVNILLNAVQVSPSRSTLTVSAWREGAEIVIEVTDEGPGIDGDALERVFNPFFSTKEEGSGTGLGLSVSYGIVRHHGGRISIENRSQGGARVMIRLPVSGHETQFGEDADMEKRYVG